MSRLSSRKRTKTQPSSQATAACGFRGIMQVDERLVDGRLLVEVAANVVFECLQLPLQTIAERLEVNHADTAPNIESDLRD